MMYVARIHVTLKQSVLDPQGSTIENALHTLGYEEVKDVRIGKLIELKLEASDRETANERVRAMCDNLLANVVIEKYEFELAEAGA